MEKIRQIDRLLSNKDLVEALAKTNLTKFCAELCKRGIISRKVKNTFNFLDHDHTEEWVKVRYLLNFVFQSIKSSGHLWGKFLMCLQYLKEDKIYNYLRLNVTAHDEDDIMNISLTSSDIPILIELLAIIVPYWETFGTTLGLTNSSQYGDPIGRNRNSFINILTHWISNPPALGVPRLSEIQRVLREQTMNQGKLANKLEEEFRQLREERTNSQVDDPSEEFEIIYCSDDTDVTDGKSTLLGVLCSHQESVTYQWERNGQPLENSISYSGVNDSVLVLDSTVPEIEGEYKCIATHKNEKFYSDEIRLSIIYSPFKKHILSEYNGLEEVFVSSSLTGTKTFINVNLREIIQSEKQGNSGETNTQETVYYHDIFDRYKEGALIFCTGKPGSGKTTLMTKVIKDWACGRVLIGSKIVFYIPLYKCKMTEDNCTLFDILNSCYNYLSKEVLEIAEKVERKDGKGFCFVLDGLDEYQLTDKSRIYNLISKKYLSSAEVIVSSRPVGLPKVQCTTYKEIEVIGFNKETLFMFIDLYCGASVGGKLKQYLKSLYTIPSIYYLPLNACLICYIYKYSDSDYEIPDTETKLYEKVILLMIQHHLKKHNKWHVSNSPRNLKDITGLHNVCKLAYSLLHKENKDSETVNLEHLKAWDIRLIENDIDILSLEMFHVRDKDSQTGENISLSFIHSNFRDFLAAYCIVNFTKQEKLEEYVREIKRWIDYIKTRKNTHYYSKIPTTVWIFYCGLETFSFDGDFECFKHIIIFSKLDKINFAVEASQDEVRSQIMQTFCQEFCFEGTTEEKLYIYFNRLVTQSEQTDVRVSTDSENLELYFRNVKDEILQDMRALCTTEYVEFNQISSFVTKLQTCTHLEILELKLRNVTFNVSNLLAANLKSFTNLKRVTLLCKPGDGNGIPQLLHRLQELDFLIQLKLEEIDADDIRKISNKLQQLKTSKISVLQMSKCVFNLNVSERFANGVSKLVHLNTLNLSHNKIAGEISHTAKALKHLQNLQRLDLSNNQINSEGAEDLSLEFENLNQLKYLCLSYNNIGPTGAHHLANKISHLVNLIAIDISHNQIDVTKATLLQEKLQKCSNLKIANIGLSMLAEQDNLEDSNDTAESNTTFKSQKIMLLIFVISLLFTWLVTWDYVDINDL